MHFFYEDKKTFIQAGESRRLAFGAHIHSHLEMVLIKEGRCGVAVDFTDHIVSKGDILLIFPHQVHQYHSDEDLDSLLLIFPLQIVPEFSRTFQRQLPVSPVFSGVGNDPEIAGLFHRVVAAANDTSVHSDNLFKGYLLALLSLLFAQTSFSELPPSEPETIKRVLNYCGDHYTDDIDLDQTARALHLNKHYLSHLFQEKLHMGFRTSINTLRISEACYLLRQEEHTITEIAYLLGFNSTRSFNRVFLAQQGQSPRAYRNGSLKTGK